MSRTWGAGGEPCDETVVIKVDELWGNAGNAMEMKLRKKEINRKRNDTKKPASKELSEKERKKDRKSNRDRRR